MILKVIMRTISDLRIFNSVNLLIINGFIFSLSVLYLPFANAEDIQNLQQNSSITYEHMMQAKQSAESLAKDLTFSERKLVSIKQKLSAAEQEVETIRKKTEQANISLEQAIIRWKQATDALANEWGKTERK